MCVDVSHYKPRHLAHTNTNTQPNPTQTLTQRCNLAAAHPDIVAQLLSRLEAYNRTSVPARYPPPSQLCDPARSANVFAAWGEAAAEL